MTIDVWMQHPTQRFMASDMLASLRRWTGGAIPEQDIPIAFTGLRPGEKLYEELLANDETTAPTPHPKLRVARTSGQQVIDAADVQRWIDTVGPAPDRALLRDWLRQQVPEYTSQG